MAFYIGIDSGGTHIVAQAFTTSGQQIYEATAGQGNIIINEAETVSNLKQVITTIIERQSEDTCSRILIGIAGVETSGLTATLEEEFTAHFGVQTTIMSDARLALLNGLEGDDGLLAIAGTGSVVYGKQQQHIYRVGGYGNLLGDSGSAYAIVRSAVIMALEQQDKHIQSMLEPVLAQAFGVSNLEQVKRKFYQLERKEIASFATAIAAAADKGNKEAIAVLNTEAKLLAEQVLTLLNLFTTPLPQKIALSGSVLLKNDLFRRRVISNIRQEFPPIKPLTITTNNARGVLFLDQWQLQEEE